MPQIIAFKIFIYLFFSENQFLSIPLGSERKKSTCNAGDLGSIPGLGRFPWRRERLLTPVFWPGEFHELYSTCDTKSWTQLSDFHFSLYFILKNIYLLIAALGLAARRLFRCSVQASLYCGVQVQ